MERPKVNYEVKKRQITGEVAYFEAMRSLKQSPGNYEDQTDMAVQMYEAEAQVYIDRGVRPSIMDDYEKYDTMPTIGQQGCLALADELLRLKGDTPLSFVDFVVATDPDIVVEKLQSIRAGTLMAPPDEQLAFESDGSYYPILDIKKQDMKLTGVDLRIWGWDDEKVAFINSQDEDDTRSCRVLHYPSDELSQRREIELRLGYVGQDKRSATESIRLTVDSCGRSSMGGQVYVHAYSETGYEGHNGKDLPGVNDGDLNAFADLIAEIVGDQPETVHMMIVRQLEEIKAVAANDEARLAVDRLVDITWPAQARAILLRHSEGSKSLSDRLQAAVMVESAIADINAQISQWAERRKRAQS